MKFRALSLLATLAIAASVQAQTPSPDMKAAREAVMKACEADAKTLCTDKQGRELMMCLRSSADKVGASCKDALSKMPARPAAP